jgi:uncharacterized integral membrane protein
MADDVRHDDGRKVNVKLIVLGVLGALLLVFVLLNTHEVGIDWIVDTVRVPAFLLIVVCAALGFAMGFLVRGHLANRRDD